MNAKGLYRMFNYLKECNSCVCGEGDNEGSHPMFDLSEIEGQCDGIIGYDNEEGTMFRCRTGKEPIHSFVTRHRKNGYGYFNQQQKYIGEIIDVCEDRRVFRAKLQLQGDGQIREIDFSFDEVLSSEFENIEIGKKIIYVFGREFVNGTVYNVSKVYFRKEMFWTERDIEEKKEMASELFKLMNEDE